LTLISGFFISCAVYGARVAAIFLPFRFSASGVSAFEERRNGKTKATFDRWGAKRKKTPLPDRAGVGEKKTRRKTDASF